ncbi:MAG: protein-glutamate O-methyltransferase CheR [Polaromonas sp.]|uniref:CheR family methyltransferase n=1 Tax=Polaromonas sp. TaxID=1869339 RepID=UPI0025FB4745|nr:protein-glutamate O-methyltransferase CheR [Polaromonas sp.]MBI2725523.1 protein-glutamate O-methyltransferase CheR [Polaromonas sp.]
MTPITDKELAQFRRFIFEAAGITMSEQKKALVEGRLSKRLSFHGLQSFGQYFNMLTSGAHPDEVQTAVDLLTTNETYFFREIKHFEFLRRQALACRARAQPFRVWSAASSSGEEAYSIAKALYTMERARHIPSEYLRRFCLKGSGEYQGMLLINRSLRDHVLFRQVNLNAPLPNLGQFDVIFLRNVMIYFSDDTKREVVARVISTLKPEGYFCVGHSESLNNISNAVESVAPSVYRKAV